MALEAITMEGPEARVSAQVARLIATCSRDWERFFADHDTAEARGPLRYDGMESAIADIGLFFAYPWPEERELMRQLFEAVARAGAMLVVYHTDKDIRVFRKVEGHRSGGTGEAALGQASTVSAC